MYALRACIALAGAAPGARMKAGDIAQAAAVPRGFLSKILSELRSRLHAVAVEALHGASLSELVVGE
jgi:DNA-binding IscR family transcriptional regulator